MNKRSARCVIVSYGEDEQAIQTCTVDRALVTRLMQAALTIPWPLMDENFKLDYEFARRLGRRFWSAIGSPTETETIR